MESTNNPDSGIRIENIILVESSFNRVNDVVFDKDVETNVSVNVEVGVNHETSTVNVAETVVFDQKHQGREQIKIMVKMIGVFKIVGTPSVSNLEEFGKINGAAIIFPYIREYITYCSLKASVGPIFIPPANFTTVK